MAVIIVEDRRRVLAPVSERELELDAGCLLCDPFLQLEFARWQVD